MFLVLVRLWLAFSPSYLHPDENFQGPEVIAGKRKDTGCWGFKINSVRNRLQPL